MPAHRKLKLNDPLFAYITATEKLNEGVTFSFVQSLTDNKPPVLPPDVKWSWVRTKVDGNTGEMTIHNADVPTNASHHYVGEARGADLVVHAWVWYDRTAKEWRACLTASSPHGVFGPFASLKEAKEAMQNIFAYSTNVYATTGYQRD